MKNHSDSINEIAKALNKFQQKLESASKTSVNPHFKSKYADLTAVWDAIKEPLCEAALAVTQLHEEIEGKYYLVTFLMHESGQWLKSFTPLMLEKGTPQSLGSATTYARRYGLAAVLGVTQEDDDGNAATFISNKQHALLLGKLNGHPEIFKRVSERLKQRNILSFDRITHDMFQQILEYVETEIRKKNEVKHEDE